MARLIFTIADDKKPAAVKAIKAALPKLKNAKNCIDAGKINIPDIHVQAFTNAIKPFTSKVADISADVEAAVNRLENAVGKLADKINAKTDKTVAKALHAAADFVETL